LTHQPEDDVPKVKEYVSGILDAWGLPNSVDDRHISELCRAGGAELHTVRACRMVTMVPLRFIIVRRHLVPV